MRMKSDPNDTQLRSWEYLRQQLALARTYRSPPEKNYKNNQRAETG